MHASGRLAEAEKAYRSALEKRPGELNCLLGLAQVFLDQGRPQNAAALLQGEVRQRPDSFELHLAYGTALAAQQKFKEAIPTFERAVLLAPMLPQAHFNLGRALHENGHPELAIESYRRALTGAPGAPEIHFLMGNALASLSQWQHAEQHYRLALKTVPDFPAAQVNLGNVLKAQGRFVEARTLYEDALTLQPQNADAHYNLGTLLFADGDFASAIESLQRVQALRPGWPEAANNLAIALRAAGGAAASLQWCQLALRHRPEFFDAHYNLGGAFEELRQHEKALPAYARAFQLRPESMEALEKVVATKLLLCEWFDLDRHIERLRAGAGQGKDVRPFTYFALPHVTRREQRAAAERHASEQLFGVEGGWPKRPPSRSADGRLRIGYLSADFHEHATSYLMVEAFERHDRRRVETVAYSYGPDDSSPMRSRLLSAFDRFVDVRRCSVKDLARAIHSDGIDILVDLKGYTEHHKARVLAMRPAPVQVSYLGYPGTMGADFIDYLIADRVVIPREHFEDYKEAIAWLPGCYQPNDSRRPLKSTPDRAACRLPESAFVFCCLNQSYKINPSWFDVWCRLLRRVPSGVLLLLSTHPAAEANLRAEAKRRGVQPDRVIFAERLPHPEHLARLRQADLFLDTAPYGAHTLASDALWVGVPLVTLLGETFPSRVASSLLTALGLEELIANSPTHYEEIAYAIASDRERLSALRNVLSARKKEAAVFDGGRLAKDLEDLCEEMWRRHVAGLPPAHISI